MGMCAYYLRITPRELAALEAAPETVAAVVFNEDIPFSDARRLDLDKAWHAIHFLLNSDRSVEHELFNVIFGGEPVGNGDLSVGPARALGPLDVAGMASVLSSVDATDLRERWDAQELADNNIYPGIWEGEAELEYVLGHYTQLVGFFAAAARDGDALITYLR